MTVLKVRSTAELLAEQIREAIAQGEIAPGEQLHQENLAARFGVSRSPIREALRLLEAEGLIVYHSNKGAVVAELSADDIREIFEMRELLETALIRHSAKAIDAATLQQIENLAQKLSNETDARAWLLLRREFYQAVYAPAHRPRMAAVVFAHNVRISDSPFAGQAVRLLKREFDQHHGDLIEALGKHDAQAAVATTRAQLECSKRTILSLMEGSTS